MNEEKIIKIRKDVIKNIAIVFLAIMLVLTFFSNSIMNKSLPEVAVKYIESNSISEKIRGSGTVTIDDPYNVTVTDSRKISSVAVMIGDDVQKDQVLFYLEDSDSEELVEAQKALDDLVLSYTKNALAGDISAQAYNQATTGQVSSMAVYEAQIEAAKNKEKAAKDKVSAIQDKIDSISRQQMTVDGASETDIVGAINQAQLELSQVENDLKDAQATYDALNATITEGANAGADASMKALEKANAKAEYDNQVSKTQEQIVNFTGSESVLIALKVENDIKYGAISDPNALKDAIFDSDGMIIDAQALNDWLQAYMANAGTAYDDVALSDLTKAYKTYIEKQIACQQAEELAKQYSDAASKVGAAKSNLDNLKNKANELSTKITKLNNDKEQNLLGNSQLSSGLALNKKDAETELSKANLELTKAGEELTQLLTDISKTLDLANTNSAIKEQQEKVNKLKERAIGATITAPVAGKILSINRTAGETTAPAETLATIAVAGKSMTLKISVTDEQAKKVSIGQEAELGNSWYYNDVTLRLIKILQDPESRGKNKTLVFNVEGEVADGSMLNVSMGQRSKDYDKVVPNSAIREDNQGKFILIVDSKGTPFGTRYKAKRVDVEVLATDDNLSAISAEVENWAYVITTSDKPVSSGMQVRLSDN